MVFDLAYDWGKGTTAADVLAAARNSGDRLTRYGFMSSIAGYGRGLNRRESYSRRQTTRRILYAQHKASTERALFRLHETSGFPVTTFRPPFVHGPRQPLRSEQFFCDRLLDGRPIILPEDGESPMQWAFVEDLAEACVRSIEVPRRWGRRSTWGTWRRRRSEGSSRRWGWRTVGREPKFVTLPREKIHAAGGDIFKGNLYFGEYLDLLRHTEVVEVCFARRHADRSGDRPRKRVRLAPRPAAPAGRLRLRGLPAATGACGWSDGVTALPTSRFSSSGGCAPRFRARPA